MTFRLNNVIDTVFIIDCYRHHMLLNSHLLLGFYACYRKVKEKNIKPGGFRLWIAHPKNLK